jgi:hypothetical protein
MLSSRAQPDHSFRNDPAQSRNLQFQSALSQRTVFGEARVGKLLVIPTAGGNLLLPCANLAFRGRAALQGRVNPPHAPMLPRKLVRRVGGVDNGM